jgi:hypothetical protein
VQQVSDRRPSPFLLPLFALFYLSLSDHYQVFASIPLPLINAERVTSRMISLPLVVGLILAAIALQRWLDGRIRQPLWVTLLALAGVGYLGFDLARQALNWRLTAAAAVFPLTPVNLATKIVANHADPPYTNLLLAGAAVTLVSGLVLVFLVWKETPGRMGKSNPLNL